MLNLNESRYRLYRKPNDKLSFINVFSSHPPLVFKNLVHNTSEMLSNLSSNVDIFDSIDLAYNMALKDSRFKGKIQYIPKTGIRKDTKRGNRSRNNL